MRTARWYARIVDYHGDTEDDWVFAGDWADMYDEENVVAAAFAKKCHSEDYELMEYEKPIEVDIRRGDCGEVTRCRVQVSYLPHYRATTIALKPSDHSSEGSTGT